MEFGQSGDVARAAAADQSTSDDCGACHGDEMAVVSCPVSGCIGVQAVLSQAGAPLEELGVKFDRLPEQRVSGSTAAPDPFPPKVIILT